MSAPEKFCLSGAIQMFPLLLLQLTIRNLTPCIEAVAWSCIIVTWWSGPGGIQALSERPTNWFPSVLWHCWFGHTTCKNRPLYDL